jgi:two-component sensor histidine kinase
VRSIAIQVHCQPISVKSSQAGSIGLIVNELVTNAFKYAFPEGRAGTVEVDITRTDGQIAITVRDDGVGCPSEVKSGLGTRLINQLTARMNGRMTRAPLPRGCEVRVVLSVDT